LNPVRRREIVRELAAARGLSPELVDQVVMFYYKDVSALLSGGDTIRVEVPGLGMFSARPRALEKKIRRVEGLIAVLREGSQIRQDKERDLLRLQAMQQKLQAEALRKQTLKNPAATP
jgi:nucleoid DNA-binding protein